MSPTLFETIYDDIRDPQNGCGAFMGRTDVHDIAYGTWSDSVTEYTGIKNKGQGHILRRVQCVSRTVLA